MTKLDIRRQQMLERVRAFGATYRDRFPAESAALRMFAAVAESVDALRRHSTSEISGHHGEREGSASKATARAALRRRLSAISRTARAAAIDRPGLDGRFRIRFDCSDERLLSHARAFVAAARPLARVFTAYDMPSTFLAQLQTEIDLFDRAIRAREASRGCRVAAQASIGAEIRKGVQEARRLAAILPHSVQDPALLAIWNEARRIGYPPRIVYRAPSAG